MASFSLSLSSFQPLSCNIRQSYSNETKVTNRATNEAKESEHQTCDDIVLLLLSFYLQSRSIPFPVINYFFIKFTKCSQIKLVSDSTILYPSINIYISQLNTSYEIKWPHLKHSTLLFHSEETLGKMLKHQFQSPDV